MNNSIKEQLVEAFDGIQVNTGNHGMILNTMKESVMSVLSFLKNHGYNHLGLVSCVDWIDDNEFELVYVLSAYMLKDNEHTDKEKMNIILKTRIPRERASFLSVIPVFENAEPYEREIHELFGIHFEGHPRLIPLLLEREYEIPPFRKDFDNREYVKKTFDSIPSVEKKA